GGATTLQPGMDGDLVTAREGTAPWRSPGQIPLDVAAAVPHAGYTDVGQCHGSKRLGWRRCVCFGRRSATARGDTRGRTGCGGATIIASNAMMVAPANPGAGTDAFLSCRVAMSLW